MLSPVFFSKISVPPVLVLVIKERVFFFHALFMLKRNNINKREKHFTGSGLVIFFRTRVFFLFGFRENENKEVGPF